MNNALRLTIMSLLALVMMTGLAVADVPQMINYQGRLTDDMGEPIDTTVDILFTLCIDSSGPCVWTEDHPDVVVTDGLFNVRLGEYEPLTAELFAGSNLWLHIKVGSSGGIIEPPTYLITVPYAFRVSTVDGSSGGVILGDLNVYGKVGFQLDYNSGWVSISPGETNTLTHNLGGNPDDYIVIVDGKSSGGGIHQNALGLDNLSTGNWIGLAWSDLSNTQITVSRGANDDTVASNLQWNQVRVRIISNQTIRGN